MPRDQSPGASLGKFEVTKPSVKNERFTSLDFNRTMSSDGNESLTKPSSSARLGIYLVSVAKAKRANARSELDPNSHQKSGANFNPSPDWHMVTGAPRIYAVMGSATRDAKG
jgi:hypothetical protein